MKIKHFENGTTRSVPASATAPESPGEPRRGHARSMSKRSPPRGFAFRVRAAVLGDVPALLTIERQAFRCDRASARALKALIEGPRSSVFVAAAFGTVLGYVAAQFRRGELARIYSLAVMRGVRGCGIGGALMRRAERAARAQGATRLRLEVRRSNRRARALYRALGYRKLFDLPRYYADDGDAIRMEKRLDARRHR
jgi:ribosomal protein S18 acetylase RimI-like enzyme